MKHHVLFSSKDKSKNNTVSSAAILLHPLWVIKLSINTVLILSIWTAGWLVGCFGFNP